MRRRTVIVGIMLAAAPLAFAWQDEGPIEDSWRLFRDPDLQGAGIEVRPVTSEKATRLHELDKPIRNKARSIEWNLPPGVVVVFYDNTNGTGQQFPIWGKGSRRSLAEADFEKRAAAWAWAYVDGWDGASTSVLAGLSPRPLLTQESDDRIAQNTLELQRDAGLHNKKPDQLLKVAAVTDVPAGELQRLPESLDNRASSARWNLPPGIVVVLYDTAEGTGRRIPLWGTGVMPGLRVMDNRVSAWAWYDIASEDAKPDPH